MAHEDASAVMTRTDMGAVMTPANTSAAMAPADTSVALRYGGILAGDSNRSRRRLTLAG